MDMKISVVQKLDNAIHGINIYPVDNAIAFPNTCPFEQLGPGVHIKHGLSG